MKWVKGISYRPFGAVNGRCRSRRAELRGEQVSEIIPELGPRYPLANRFNKLILIHGWRLNTKLCAMVSHPLDSYISTAHDAQI
jgi:hypothetical protein